MDRGAGQRGGEREVARDGRADAQLQPRGGRDRAAGARGPPGLGAVTGAGAALWTVIDMGSSCNGVLKVRSAGGRARYQRDGRSPVDRPSSNVVVDLRGGRQSTPRPPSRARTMAAERSGTASLVSTFETWLRTVFGLSTIRREMVRLS